MATSIGFERPVCNAAFSEAILNTLGTSFRIVIRAFKDDDPSVSVPVLSVQRTSMLPRFSIAFKCRTRTPRSGHQLGSPGEIHTENRGQEFRAKPTARAIAKRSVSMAAFLAEHVR